MVDARDVVDYLLDAFALHEVLLDERGRPYDTILVAVNARFEEMTGLPSEQIIGRRLSQVFPGLEQFWLERIAAVALQGGSEHFRHRDNHFQKWWEVSLFQVRRGRAGVVFRSIEREMEREKSEQLALKLARLRELMISSEVTPNDRVQLVLGHLRQVVGLRAVILTVRVGETERIIQDGSEELSRQSRLRNELSQRLSQELVRDEVFAGSPEEGYFLDVFDLKDFKAAAWVLLEEGREAPCPAEWRTVAGFLADVVKMDILHSMAEQRRLLEEQFLHAQRLKSLGVQAGVIAHDFNNLLAGLLSRIELMLLSEEQDFPRREELREIQALLLHGRDLTTQLLSFAGLESLQMQEVDLAVLLESARKMLRSALPRSLDLRLEVQDRPTFSVLADEGRIRQVLLNLSVNAAEALRGRPGKLVIGVRPHRITSPEGWHGHPLEVDKDYALLYVQDDGPGIPPSLVARVFEPFFTTKPGGHGLGLSAVLNIVREHHGGVRVQSEEGRGTRFEILFPALRPLPGEVNRPQWPEVAACQEKDTSLRILLIEDEPALLEVHRQLLECQGHEVEAFLTGEEALAVFPTRPFDSIIMDWTMPGLSGEELWLRLRELEREVPILITTGFSPQALPDSVLGDPACRVIQKPFEVRQLMALLGELTGA